MEVVLWLFQTVIKTAPTKTVKQYELCCCKRNFNVVHWHTYTKSCVRCDMPQYLLVFRYIYCLVYKKEYGWCVKGFNLVFTNFFLCVRGTCLFTFLNAYLRDPLTCFYCFCLPSSTPLSLCHASRSSAFLLWPIN